MCMRLAPVHLRGTVQSMLFCLYYGAHPPLMCFILNNCLSLSAWRNNQKQSLMWHVAHPWHAGVGPGISGLAGGFIMAAVGLRMVFVIGCLVCLGLWLCTLLALWLATRGERREHRRAADAVLEW